MEKENVRVRVGNETKTYAVGTTYQTIAREQANDPEEIVLAYVDGKLTELFQTVQKDCTLEFETTAGTIGHATYKRSLSFMMVKAIYDVVDPADIEKVRIQYALSKGYYCTVKGKVPVDQAFLDKLEARMHALVEQDVPIGKHAIDTDEAIALFDRLGMYDKKKLFNYRLVSSVNLYNMEDYVDYNYGYMVPSAGYLKYFRLYLYDEGFVIQMPEKTNPKVVPPFEPQRKLSAVLKETKQWGDAQGIETVGALNDRITRGDVNDVVLVQEALQEKKIAEIAREITERSDVRFVLIAGPSSSGKTTFSRRLCVQLAANGRKPYPITVDNYFVEREETPRDANGDYDFECLGAIDVPLFNRQMNELLAGKEVVLPTFDFVHGHKEYVTAPRRLQENGILVIEGIHCLNPGLTVHLARENTYKIYISALTQLNIDEHNRIPSTDGRLIRRIVRDARVRGTSASSTIQRWDAVRRGEEANIFPYQEEADVMFNSALIYELAVLKPYVEQLLFGIDRDAPAYLEAKRLLKFLDYFVGIDSESVPTNSLLREFIGGGCFHVT